MSKLMLAIAHNELLWDKFTDRMVFHLGTKQTACVKAISKCIYIYTHSIFGRPS